jgi:hypothetical protein
MNFTAFSMGGGELGVSGHCGQFRQGERGDAVVVHHVVICAAGRRPEAAVLRLDFHQVLCGGGDVLFELALPVGVVGRAERQHRQPGQARFENGSQRAAVDAAVALLLPTAMLVEVDPVPFAVLVLVACQPSQPELDRLFSFRVAAVFPEGSLACSTAPVAVQVSGGPALTLHRNNAGALAGVVGPGRARGLFIQCLDGCGRVDGRLDFLLRLGLRLVFVGFFFLFASVVVLAIAFEVGEADDYRRTGPVLGGGQPVPYGVGQHEAGDDHPERRQERGRPAHRVGRDGLGHGTPERRSAAPLFALATVHGFLIPHFIIHGGTSKGCRTAQGRRTASGLPRFEPLDFPR